MKDVSIYSTSVTLQNLLERLKTCTYSGLNLDFQLWNPVNVIDQIWINNENYQFNNKLFW